jgi:uncharacterized protein YecT (DUF1311 family)
MSGTALAAGGYPPGEPGMAPPPPGIGEPVSLTVNEDDDHNAPVAVRAEAPESPMGMNPVTTVDAGPADIAPAPVMSEPPPEAPQALMTPPATESPVRADNEEAGTMVPSATTMTASEAVTVAGPADFSSLCHADATGNVDIHTCLKNAAADADAKLEAAQAQELRVARGGADWKEGRKQAQLLSTSAMSFNAYRDSECMRQQQATVPGQKTGDIMLACQIRLTEARIAMLGQPAAPMVPAQEPAPEAAQQPEAAAPAPLVPMDAQPIPAP